MHSRGTARAQRALSTRRHRVDMTTPTLLLSPASTGRAFPLRPACAVARSERVVVGAHGPADTSTTVLRSLRLVAA